MHGSMYTSIRITSPAFGCKPNVMIDTLCSIVYRDIPAMVKFFETSATKKSANFGRIRVGRVTTAVTVTRVSMNYLVIYFAGEENSQSRF